VVARQAAFLMDDGSVVCLDGNAVCSFAATITDNLFVVIYHRNHLAIMSANPLTKTGEVYTYDFTTANEKAYNSGQKDLGSGKSGMIAGDANADGGVNTTDKSLWNAHAGTKGYLLEDFDLDGEMNNRDKNDKWAPNNGETGQVPE
jgi:hypothetical protein